MEIRDKIATGLKSAMKNQDKARLGTLRLINAAIKDKDIALRGAGGEAGVTSDDILGILGKMIKQRQESARAYDEAGRLDLAERERDEVVVIEEFLPKKLNDAEVSAAIESAIQTTGAVSIRDMGKVIGLLKTEYMGRMDFGTVGPMIKDRLG